MQELEQEFKQEVKNELLKNETIRLKELIESFTDEELREAISGKRPEIVNIADFKVIRKSMQGHIDKHIKGKMVHISSKADYDGNNKLIAVRTNTKPYVKPIKKETNGTQS